jgi:hypothetical protein
MTLKVLLQNYYRVLGCYDVKINVVRWWYQYHVTLGKDSREQTRNAMWTNNETR